MLSFMLYPKTELSWSLKIQKSSLDWWCHLLVSRCCWIRSTTLSCLLILGLKRCMLCCLPVYDGHSWDFLAIKSFSLVKFVNVLRIVHKHPQDCWNHYPLLIEGLDLGLWILSLAYPLVLMVVMPFLPVFWLFDKVHCLDCMYFRGRGVEWQPSCTVVFLGCCQTVWPAWQCCLW